MDSDQADVVIAGAGPVGMWLAIELQAQNIQPMILEAGESRPPGSKALTVQPRTLEVFAQRGLADMWLNEGSMVPSSHYGMLTSRLDYSTLDTLFPFVLFIPQTRTEELLEDCVGARWKGSAWPQSSRIDLSLIPFVDGMTFAVKRDLR